jgi:pimeloyl-ACP methyl ester carboxylesterase
MAIDAVTAITGLVEDMHRNIARASPIVGKEPRGRTSGVTGFVYSSIRGVTRTVGAGLDLALRQLEPFMGRAVSSPKREAIRAALNGALGDYFVTSGSPFAIPMRLRRDGVALELTRDALAAALPDAGPRVLILAHGLCMNDLQWTRDGHNHGAALAQALGCTALYLHYNSGLHISTSGRGFAELLDQAMRAWPVPVEEIVIVGHSMGGLVARSALHHARAARLAWPARLKAMVFLGSPHHGAPLERASNRANMYVGISPYTAPFTRLAKLRSAGIQDLRHGNLLDSDWEGVSRGSTRDRRTPLPLPARVRCYAIAATRQAQPADNATRLPGDGLVPVASALGRHADPRFALAFAAGHTRICYGVGHFDLLSSREVFDTMRGWLAAGAISATRSRRPKAG